MQLMCWEPQRLQQHFDQLWAFWRCEHDISRTLHGDLSKSIIDIWKWCREISAGKMVFFYIWCWSIFNVISYDTAYDALKHVNVSAEVCGCMWEIIRVKQTFVSVKWWEDCGSPDLLCFLIYHPAANLQVPVLFLIASSRSHPSHM